jgi:hypothetical protein
MRLTRDQEIIAREELLDKLRDAPDGLSTQQLRGTRRFRGARALTAIQVVRLLRTTCQAVEYSGSAGMGTATLWKFNRVIPANATEVILLDFLRCKAGSLRSPDTRHVKAVAAVLAQARAWGFKITHDDA